MRIDWRHREGTCAIHLGADAVERILELPVLRAAPAVVCLVDRTVAGEHPELLKQVLTHLPEARWIEVPAGEAAKSFAQLEVTLETFAELGLRRDGAVLAIGGGACTDLSGLAAALWMRGIAWIAVPTTLLAMVDASVGGKTAINSRVAKNLIGTFHAPRAVAVDPRFLSTLPARELRSGMAEVIKAALLRTDRAFEQLEQLPSHLALDAEEWRAVIAPAVQLKVDIVERDEREGGPRRALNLGHTLAHGLELASGYGALGHGEAVSIGMVAACDFAVQRGLFPIAARDRVVALLRRFELPVAPHPSLSIQQIVSALQLDKKVLDGRLRYVLPRGLPAASCGDVAYVDDVTAVEIERWLYSSMTSSSSSSA